MDCEIVEQKIIRLGVYKIEGVDEKGNQFGVSICL